MRIDRLVEIPALPLDKEFLFANVTDEVIAANRGWLDHRYIEPETGPLHSQPPFLRGAHAALDRHRRYLLRQPQGRGRAGHGTGFNHARHRKSSTACALPACSPRTIDIVMCTHLHADHVGWNTRLDSRPLGADLPQGALSAGTRRNMTIGTGSTAQNPERAVNRGSFVDSAPPVVAAGQAEFVEQLTTACSTTARPAFRFVPAPGHTIGNMMIDLRGGHDHAVDVRRRHPSPDPVRGALAVERRRLSTRPRRTGHPRQAAGRGSPIRRAFLLTGHFPADRRPAGSCRTAGRYQVRVPRSALQPGAPRNRRSDASIFIEPVMMQPVAGARTLQQFSLLKMRQQAGGLGIWQKAFVAPHQQGWKGNARPQGRHIPP